MATITIEDHIDAHIIVDGAKATEYPAEPQKDESTGQEVTTKYVEVVSGAQFSFQATISPQYRYGPKNVLVMRVYIDGSFAAGSVWGKHLHNHFTGSTPSVQCTWEGTGPSAKKLMLHFADLETRMCHTNFSNVTVLIDFLGDITATDELKSLASQYDQLGTLEVRITREMDYGDTERRSKAVNNTGIIPEKALKGRSLNVAAQ